MQVTTIQHPSTKDNVRKALIVAIRMNYRRMHDTLIPSYQKVFLPSSAEAEIEGDGVYSGVKDGKLDHVFAWVDPHLGPCQMTVLFRAFGETDIESFIRGFEPTAFWLNEADELPEDCLGLLYQRTGRAYLDERPDDVAPVAYPRLFGDLNMPDEDSWFYNDVYLKVKEGKKPGVKIYVQPSGFSPNAENLHVLRREQPDYYQKKAEKMQPWQVRRFLENKVGLSRHGDPVYPAFSDANTSSKNMAPAPRVKLIIGVDQDLTPAAVIGQKDPEGRLLLHHEFVTPPNEIYGAFEFGADLAQIMLDEYRPWCGRDGFEFILDKNAWRRESDQRQFAVRFMQGVLSKLRYCPLWPCPTSLPNILHDSVNHFLRTSPRRGGGPGLLVNPRCLMLRRGGISGYRLKMIKRTDGAKVYKQDKNEYSHVWNAAEFVAYRAKSGPLSEETKFDGVGTDTNPYSPEPSRGGVIRQPEVILEEEFI